jgi:hypothetical protein
MADEMGEIFAEQLGGEVVSDGVQEQMLQPTTVDLTSTAPVESTPTQQESSEPSTEQAPIEQAPMEVQDSNDRSLNVESNQSQVEDSRPDTEYNENDFLGYVNEQFETKFDSIDQFRDTLSSEPKSEFANEQIASMNKFVSETGRSVNDYLRTQTADYSKMPNEHIMLEHLRMSNPELSGKELQLYFESKYKVGEGKFSESEQTLGKIELKKDASQARQELTDWQNSYKTPENNDGMTSEEAEKIRGEWLDNMNSEVDQMQSLTFDINDQGETFDFALNDEHKSSLADNNSDLSNFFDRYIDEGGKWDFDQLNIDMFIRDNFDQIIRSVANQYRSKGTEQVIQDIKNPTFNNNPRTSQGGEDKSVIDKLDDQIFGGSGSLWNN